MRGRITILILVWTAVATAADWSSCEDDLNTLRRRASDASDAASTVRDRAENLSEKRNDWEQCRLFPEVYDLLRDGCQSQRWDYENARTDYESAKSDLEGYLDDIASTLRSVEYSCGFAFSVGSAGRPTGDQFCRLLQRYKSTMPLNTLLQVCMKSRSEEECRKCLQ
jgi:hypothetical protein